MSTEAELLALARAEALKTTTTPEQFLASVRKAGYAYGKTHWFKAMLALEQLKHQPPPTPAGPDLGAVQNLIVFATIGSATVPADDAVIYACRLGPPWKILFTADPNYQAPLTFAMMKAVEAAGMGPYCWIGPGLSPATCAGFRDQWAAKGVTVHGWYGEGETPGGFDQHTAYTPWPTIGLIGNLSALRPDQQAKVKTGEVLFNWEAYYNKADQHYGDIQSYLDNTGPYKGTDKTTLCYAVYASSSENAAYTPAAQQKANGWIAPHASWYVEGFTEADWKAIGA